MGWYGRKVRRFADKVPGKFLGEFRFLPIFFVAGAGLEFAMIKWHVGEVNFYKTYKKNRVREAVAEKLKLLQQQSG